jgi:hypothetical protein
MTMEVTMPIWEDEMRRHGTALRLVWALDPTDFTTATGMRRLADHLTYELNTMHATRRPVNLERLSAYRALRDAAMAYNDFEREASQARLLAVCALLDIRVEEASWM